MKRFDMEIQSQPYYMGDDDEGESYTVSPYESTKGDWVQWDDVSKLEESHSELLQALELAEKKLLRLHISLSLNEKAGRRSADKDPALQEIRAAITKAKGGQQ